MARTLQAPVTVAFDYTRSTGPVLCRFFSGLRDGVVVGGRTSSGQVLVPPGEFDPDTHEPTTDFVEVAPSGTVTSWVWVPEPVAAQPFDRPFAWALVTLDGAERLLRQSYDTNVKTRGVDHPNTSVNLQDLGTIAAMRGDPAAAEALLRQALAMQRKALGNHHPVVAATLNSLSRALLEERRYDESAAAESEAAAIAASVLGADHQLVAIYTCNLAAVHVAGGNAAAALSRNCAAGSSPLSTASHSVTQALPRVSGSAMWGRLWTSHSRLPASRCSSPYARPRPFRST